MSVARSNAPLTLKLLPDLAAAAPKCAAGYGLPFSSLVAALVWNDAHRPDTTLIALPRTGKIIRQPLPCSLRAQQRRMAVARANAQNMSLNAYLEALIAAQLVRPTAPLVIYHA